MHPFTTDTKAALLERLLRPKSIAVLGGSWAHSVIEQCQRMGFAGDIWPVHPTRKDVLGIPCFASLNDLPAAPDAAFIGVNREATIELVATLATMQAGGAVCFASGFGEAAEEDASANQLQQDLLDAAGDMPILGPNCYGFINYLDSALLWPDQHGGVTANAGVALITQSSNIAINLTMQARGLPLAYVLTAGNQASVSIAQLAMSVLQDERVSALGLHIEGFGSVREFEALAALAQGLGKSIVAIKVGKSEKAQHALVSHTNSIAGSDAAADAFLNRLGIARVTSLSVMLETLKILHVSAGGTGKRILSMSCSGGEACLMGDAITDTKLELPELDANQQHALREALGSRVALANPLDYHTYIWNDAESMFNMFAAMLEGDADVAVLVLDFPRPDRCTFPSWELAIDAFKRAGKDWNGVLAVMATLPDTMPEEQAQQLISAGVVPLCGLDDGVLALLASSTLFNGRHAVQQQIAPNQSAMQQAGRQQTLGQGLDPLQVNGQLQPPVPVFLPKPIPDDVELNFLSEREAKQWLHKHEVPVPLGCVVSDSDTFNTPLKVDDQPLQYPVVVKQLGLAHKSDVGGIRLGIADDQQLHETIYKMCGKHVCLVEEQLPEATLELLVGITRDPVHGLRLSIGQGGVYTEILKDIGHGLLPVSEANLHGMLQSLRCYPLMQGYRGKPGVSIDKLVKTLMLIQAAALSIGDQLQELEINPLMCSETSVVAVDALLQVAGTISEVP